jgi:Leucine-rich repeat (LRR) protein
MNNLATINQNSKLALSKAKNLLNTTKEILANKKISIDDSSIERLWQWADKNNIPDLHWNKSIGRYWGFPRDRKKLLKLNSLNLEDCNITELPQEIGNLTNLVKFRLSYNQLTSLPQEISNLNNLTEFNLSKNKLTNLPKEILNLSKLTKLWLSSNHLINLPNKIDSLNNLTEFYLYGNQLTSLPKEICNLTNLLKCDLSYNSNLILDKEQKIWIKKLRKNGCRVAIDNDLL